MRPEGSIELSRRAVVLGLAASAAASRAAPRLELRTDSSDSVLDAVIAAAMAGGGYPGIAVVVEQHGKLVYRKAFGEMDVENHVPASPTAVLPVGSITKTMTGLLVMQQVEAGKIDPSAKAGAYLPDLPAPARDIAVHHLLDHTSGLVNYMELPDFPWSEQRPISREEMVRWFAARPLLSPPGTRYSYTNSGLYLLGLILEAVTGRTYEELLRRHIFDPFGMGDSGLVPWETVLPRRAHGYLPGEAGLRNAPRYDLNVPFSAGAVSSTVDDLLAFRRGVFGPATPAGVRRRLLEQRTLASGRLIPYTQGCLGVGTLSGHRRLFHPGDIFGFSGQYAYYPDDELTIALLTNLQGGPITPVSVEQKLARALLGLPPLVTRDLTLEPKIGRALEGEYAVGEIRFGVDRLNFAYTDGKLALSFGSRGSGTAARPLLYQGGLVFASPVDDEQRFRFSRRDGAWEVVMTYYGSDFLARKS